MKRMQIKEFCQRHGVSRMTLSRWRHAGKIVVTPAGDINVGATDELLRAAGLGRFRVSAAGGDPALSDAARRKEVALARRRRQEWETRSAEWLLRADAAAIWAAEAADVRAGFAGLAALLAPRVAACSRPGQAQALLQGAISQALATVSGVARDSPDGGRKGPPDFGIPASATKVLAATVKTDALALLHQLQVDIDAGVVVRVAEVAAALGVCFSAVRSRLWAIQGELPPGLVGRPVDQVELRLNSAIEDALAELPTIMTLGCQPA